MSDFLNQFDKNNYKGASQPPQVKQEEIAPVPQERPVPASQRQNVAIQGPVHPVERDTSFHKNQIIKYLIIFVIIAVLCVTGYFIFRSANSIDVKPMTGGNLDEAKSWALKNRIELNITYEFDLNTKKEVILSQFPESGKIQHGEAVDVVVSSGPDPDEVLKLPDFSSMNTNQVRSWISENKATNANVIQEYSETVEDKAFIKLEFRSDLVNESNYTRKDMMIVYMSKGVEPLNANITIIDFKGKSKNEAEAWADTNKIKLVFEEESSDEIPQGYIISQSIKKGEKVGEDTEIKLVLSLGSGITVPHFSYIPMSEAAGRPDLNVTVEYKYSASVAYGNLISQSVPAGTKIYGDKRDVKVVYSLGKPYIDNVIGYAEKDLPAYFYEFKTKGANITYTIEYVDGSEPKGSVVYSSLNNEYIPLTAKVYIQVSLGNLEEYVPPTDFPPVTTTTTEDPDVTKPPYVS